MGWKLSLVEISNKRKWDPGYSSVSFCILFSAELIIRMKSATGYPIILCFRMEYSSELRLEDDIIHWRRRRRRRRRRLWRCSAAVRAPHGKGCLHITHWKVDQAGLCKSESPLRLYNSFVRKENRKGIKEDKVKWKNKYTWLPNRSTHVRRTNVSWLHAISDRCLWRQHVWL